LFLGRIRPAESRDHRLSAALWGYESTEVSTTKVRGRCAPTTNEPNTDQPGR
jgi:hypothetical protein